MTPEDVPAGPLLIDTDVATWLLTDAPQTAPWRPLLRGHALALCFASVGELLALPIVKGWKEKRADEWTGLIRQHFAVVPFNIDVTRQWAPLHVRYRGHLHGGGANDLWIAATALAASPRLPLATNNLKDFQTVAKDFPLTVVHPDL